MEKLNNQKTELKEVKNAFLLGILSIPGSIFILPGIILGIIGFNKSRKIISAYKKDKENFSESDFKKASNGKILSIIGIILSLLLAIAVQGNEKDKTKQTNLSEQTNLLETDVDSIKEPIEQKETILPFKEIGKSDMIVYDSNGNKETKIKYKTTFEILKESDFAGKKYTYDIRLSNNKLNKDELAQLANILKERLKKDYDRIFISYYLPNMKIGFGAWATSHFEPNLTVNIIGHTADYEETTKNDCDEKLQELSFVKDRIEEDIEMIEQYYRDNSQQKFNDLIGGLVDVVEQTNIQEKKDVERASSCCPEAQTHLENAMSELLKFTKAYVNVYSNGKKDINIYKNRIKAYLQKANKAIKRCK